MNDTGVLRFFNRNGSLLAEKVSQNLAADLWLVANDWGSPLRQAATYSFAPFRA